MARVSAIRIHFGETALRASEHALQHFGVTATFAGSFAMLLDPADGSTPIVGEHSLTGFDALRRARLDDAATVSHHSNVSTNEIRRPKCPPGCCNVPCFNEKLVARLRASLPDDERLEDARIIFAAVADKTRLKVLLSLSGGAELCVCDVAHVLGMSVSSASHHLRKLRDLRILKYRNDGKMAYYSLRNGTVGTIVDRALRATA
jgi:DNA-binding transcriptional ArsR family regulator